ncbi:aminomethyl-transferring glycine dehydrogenase subunit GcvPB [Candidatus Bathyarchaeota archaeon]|nr:aminomethyl-transferring glycine dehydrogenase subunit GcvPB [Candidatus Bathyarchaeota archaeon]
MRRYHAHVWEEPIIMQMGSEGERGIAIPITEKEIRETVGSAQSYIPAGMSRRRAAALPQISQPHVLRHYLRLSQQTLGMALNIDIGMGTCTMKYSPQVNEELVRLPQFTDLHPFQDEDTVQGILQIMYEFSRMMCEISGMDEFTFQPGGGAHGIYTNACMIRKYHALNGELNQRDEIISTIFSHPADAACPATAGFKVVSLYPDPETGLPGLEALKAAVSKRTAGLMITNPEDTGIFNPMIDEFVDIVHEAGGLCAYDQANSNALFGIARAKDAGFDMCHFNIHKAFSSPHGCMGPACGAVGTRKELADYLPVPIVTFDGARYHLDYNRKNSIGKVRCFFGNVETILRAYAWVIGMGPDGLREVSETSIINTNYMIKKILSVRGVTMAYPKQTTRLDQVRFSLETLREDTGVTTNDVARRMIDFGVQEYFTSHHPWIVPEPFLPEPCDTYSKEDIDYWVEVIRHVCEEAYRNPETVKTAPHNHAIAKINIRDLDDPDKYAMTWRAYMRKSKSRGGKQR